ncbi:MAG: GTP cyclohydrolase I FolE [Planctomycetes bacterium]|nr:GTP cyclohydrolase I FolE [Planctomycetota bacterium]
MLRVLQARDEKIWINYFRKSNEMVSEDKLVVDAKRIENAVTEILSAIGEDLGREGVKGTPQRVAKMYAELLAGMREDPSEHVKRVFNEKYDEIVLLRDISFYSICEHHLMPFIGSAHVAYLPAGAVLGVSKLARIVDCFARRLQVQERLTDQIADFLMDKLKPQGVAVVLEASHSCMTIRGIRKPGSMMVTSSLRGVFKKDPRSRNEVMSLIHNGNK